MGSPFFPGARASLHNPFLPPSRSANPPLARSGEIERLVSSENPEGAPGHANEPSRPRRNEHAFRESERGLPGPAGSQTPSAPPFEPERSRALIDGSDGAQPVARSVSRRRDAQPEGEPFAGGNSGSLQRVEPIALKTADSGSAKPGQGSACENSGTLRR